MSMLADAVEFRGYSCFKEEWAGFGNLRPINVVIGRNNTGKSRLLDLAEILCRTPLAPNKGELRCSGILQEDHLRRSFDDRVSGGNLVGNHWDHNGRFLVGSRVQWEVNSAGNPINVFFGGGIPSRPNANDDVRTEMQRRVQESLREAKHSTMAGKVFRRLLADRDIQPDLAVPLLTLQPDGRGATNIIRKYLTSSNPELSREVIRVELLNALNEVFGADGQFTEIEVMQHDDGPWEVYLAEHAKGLVPLSGSGSGLKTVILVLLNLLVIPGNENKKPGQYVFAFEELENNLHPALLRRLLRYIEGFVVAHGATVFLTTHSSAALDLFGVSEHATITSVSHTGTSAKTSEVSGHFSHLAVIAELGSRPSDLLQANGIVWVEGPSDRIYLNKWIELFSEGRLREGRDYQCAFYGGALLARAEFVPPESEDALLANLLRLNGNIVVVCDGDRKQQDAGLKDRVERVRRQVEQVPGSVIWITAAREIENYLTADVLSKALEMSVPRSPLQYENVFARASEGTDSYLASVLGRTSCDKVDLALLTVPHMESSPMRTQFDLGVEMARIVKAIDAWNA